MTFRWPSLLLLLTTVALAASPDPRGWTAGTVAAGAERILKGPDPEQLPELSFPKDFARRLDRRTVLFYFSPGCPHCQAVGAEVEVVKGAHAGKGIYPGGLAGWGSLSPRTYPP